MTEKSDFTPKHELPHPQHAMDAHKPTRTQEATALAEHLDALAAKLHGGMHDDEIDAMRAEIVKLSTELKARA